MQLTLYTLVPGYIYRCGSDSPMGTTMQVQAEKVLSTWRREGLFAPEILSEYEVLSSTR